MMEPTPISHPVQSTPATAATKDKAFAILEGLRTVMLLTTKHSADAGPTRGRPLRVARLEPSGTLWFVVSRGSTFVADLVAEPRCSVSGCASDSWIHLTGVAELVEDPALLRDVWSVAYDVWFQGGPQDPDVTLLRFVPNGVEFWDSSGLTGLRLLVAAAKSLFGGEPMEDVRGAHGALGEAE